jgi:hypothetical protein
MSVMEAIKAVSGDNGIAPGKMLGDLIARSQPNEGNPGTDVRNARQARLG